MMKERCSGLRRPRGKAGSRGFSGNDRDVAGFEWLEKRLVQSRGGDDSAAARTLNKAGDSVLRVIPQEAATAMATKWPKRKGAPEGGIVFAMAPNPRPGAATPRKP